MRARLSGPPHHVLCVGPRSLRQSIASACFGLFLRRGVATKPLGPWVANPVSWGPLPGECCCVTWLPSRTVGEWGTGVGHGPYWAPRCDLPSMCDPHWACVGAVALKPKIRRRPSVFLVCPAGLHVSEASRGLTFVDWLEEELVCRRGIRVASSVKAHLLCPRGTFPQGQGWRWREHGQTARGSGQRAIRSML